MYSQVSFLASCFVGCSPVHIVLFLMCTLQSLLTFPYIAGERNILQTVLLSFFQCLFS